MANKRPSFQFYPGDWRKDPGVQSLDYESRGVWWELCLIMFECEPRGKLALNGMPMTDEDVAILLGLPEAKLKQIEAKLLSKGVAKREQNTGVIYCKRMVEDNEKSEAIKRVRSEAGRKGGLKSSKKLEAKAKQKSEAKQAASSSSSTSVNGIVSSNTIPLKQKSEAKSSKTAEREKQAEEVLAYCTTLKYLASPENPKTKIYRECVRVIAERIKDGQTVEELKSHAEKFAGKAMAHEWYEKNYEEEPKLNSRYWCPCVRWTPDQLFGPLRFQKYFPVWAREPVITKEHLWKEFERRQLS